MHPTIDHAASSEPDTLANAPSDFSPRLLIVDDDQEMRTLLQKIIEKKCRCRVQTADSGETAWKIIQTSAPDVIITDIKMAGMDGISLLQKIKKLAPDTAVILMTGYGTVQTAVKALKFGAYDFFEKPFDNEHLVHAVHGSLEKIRLIRENRQLHQKLADNSDSQDFVGRSPRLLETIKLIRRVADTDVTVLIRGESGTGKELAAQALHRLSSRGKRDMITVNCPALPEHILESELFGYAKGAFTGATKSQNGLFLDADHSTILLDEIGDMPLSLQTKLLRVLQDKVIRPLGQTASFKVNVRILASTNQNLEEKISQGLFREDLFYRLNVVTVTMPSLSETTEDIPLLAQHFLKQFCRQYGQANLEFTPEAIKLLIRHAWPGNIRQLQNVIKRAVLLADGATISATDLCQDKNDNGKCPEIAALHCLLYNDAKQQLITQFSKSYLIGALTRNSGNVTAAAQASGLGRQAFQRLLRNYDINADHYRASGKE